MKLTLSVGLIVAVSFLLVLMVRFTIYDTKLDAMIVVIIILYRLRDVIGQSKYHVDQIKS